MPADAHDADEPFGEGTERRLIRSCQRRFDEFAGACHVILRRGREGERRLPKSGAPESHERRGVVWRQAADQRTFGISGHCDLSCLTHRA